MIFEFLTNAQVLALIPDAVDCNGDGPTRLVEMGSTWRVVVVNDTEILGTAIEFPKGMSEADRKIPCAEIESPQT